LKYDERKMKRFRKIFIGAAKNPRDKGIFHKLSLVAFLAWVGLGADGLSSSCYGPEEAFLALKGHPYLGIFVALASGLTIFIIATSYSQIIELFPTGGGGYLVASKLLSPTVGMISGCALLIDYVLTISISIASGADAIFSFLPGGWYSYKLEFAVFGLIILTVLNLRGIKEAVVPLVPIFLAFVVIHVFAIVYAVFSHIHRFDVVYNNTAGELTGTVQSIGIFGVLFLILRAYSMGAGTFTGIEAVSNGLPVLREPRVHTGRRTMTYMAVSLAFTVIGLMISYLLFNVRYHEGKTLNAVLFESITSLWGNQSSYIFVLVALLSEAILLFIAAQAGFLDGPRVLASMSLDRWFPARFSTLSDRLVTQNGIMLMGIAALLMMLLTRGSVKFLVILYSINVFITFSLSQLGMVKHWWNERNKEKKWLKKLLINGVGLSLTSFILISVTIIKFSEGGWITLVVTGSLILLAFYIRAHYKKTSELFVKLNTIVDSVEASIYNEELKYKSNGQASNKTAAILVNGFNGLGLHTLLSTIKLFSGNFKNYIFIQVGAIDAGNFKGIDEIDNLNEYVKKEADRYVEFMHKNGYHSEAFTSIGIDIAEEIEKILPKILNKYSNTVFFGGQIVFPKETFATRWLHNYIVFTLQKKFYREGLPFVILPIRL
jgi:amino acid transporter